jgi:molybdopterin-dependent oxidoreductase alpha subunit
MPLRAPPKAAGGFPAVWAVGRTLADKLTPLTALRALTAANQVDGFDCPGCAWPDPATRHRLELCENGVKAIADEATRHRVTPAFFARHSVEELGRHSDWWLNRQGRLTHPMLLEPGATHYTPVSWDEAFTRIASALQALDSPDEALFYTSGRTSNEAAFLYQLFVRQFGTNNLPDCSNMCHESSGTGMSEVIGLGKGTVTLQDLHEAELILVVGQNPGTNHPRMLSALQEAKRNGATIVSINPLKEPGLLRFKHPQELAGMLGGGTLISDHYLQVRINGDVALLKGVMKALLELEEAQPGSALDRDFLREHTEGFEALAEDLRQEPWSVLVSQSGISAEDQRALARLIASRQKIIACWAMGLTQHVNGVANVQAVLNLLLLRGAIGKPGAGPCPVRGHSNVQGDRTMGIWEKPPAAFLDALGARFGFEPPRHEGHATVTAIKAMHEGRAKVFFGLGGNFLSASPDTAFTADALRRCHLTVHVSTKLNRAHLVTGQTALILPCLGRTERDLQPGGPQLVTVENSMGIVHASQGHLAPASEHLLSEPRIVARIAEATLGTRTKVPWRELADDYDRIRDHIAAVVPGFTDMNARVRQPGGFALPNPVRDHRTFPTPDGKARLTVHPVPRHDLPPGGLLMMTIRSHDQYNTTVYGLDDRYRGLYQQRRVVLMHPDDLSDRGLLRGQLVTLISHFRDEQREAPDFIALPYDIPRGCSATYFPEANVLVPLEQTAVGSLTPASKSVVITVRPQR